MDFFAKNWKKHLFLLGLSVIFLYPLVGYLNKSYYTTISRVNYWEEKTIVSLITHILTSEENPSNLDEALGSIKFFDIKIVKNGELLIHKNLEKLQENEEQINNYKIKQYELIIAKRKYATANDDYLYYLKAWATPEKLFGNRTLTVLLGNLVILFLLELIWLVFSIKFRMNQLQLFVENKFQGNKK
jgi:hypothetical protein